MNAVTRYLARLALAAVSGAAGVLLAGLGIATFERHAAKRRTSSPLIVIEASAYTARARAMRHHPAGKKRAA
jgi:hypothetical protein